MSVDVAGRFEAVRAAIEDAVSQAQMAMSERYELGRKAAAHGWEGAALAVRAAYDQLVSAVSSLHSALDAADRAIAGVTGVREVVRAALDTATHTAKAAHTWSQQAEVSRLSDLLSDLAQSVDAAQASVADATAAAETELRNESARGTGGQGGGGWWCLAATDADAELPEPWACDRASEGAKVCGG